MNKGIGKILFWEESRVLISDTPEMYSPVIIPVQISKYIGIYYVIKGLRVCF